MTKKSIDLSEGIPPWEDEGGAVTQPEDNPEDLSEEEGHFFFTLVQFEDLVREYGMAQIMDSVEDDIYMEMFDYFMPPDEGEVGEDSF